eukprot:5670428-Amphidinium_carterae.1
MWQVAIVYHPVLYGTVAAFFACFSSHMIGATRVDSCLAWTAVQETKGQRCGDGASARHMNQDKRIFESWTGTSQGAPNNKKHDRQQTRREQTDTSSIWSFGGSNQ